MKRFFINRIYVFHSGFLLFLIISVFLFISFYKIDYPGFYYDEVLYANTLYNCSLPNLFNVFSFTYRGVCIPILLMPYMGALKTYLLFPFRPLFSFLGPYIVLRGFGVFVSAFSIFLFFKLLFKISRKNKLVYFGTILLGFNPSFLFGSKYDWGPVALSSLFVVVLLYLLTSFYYERNPKYFYLAFPLLLIGIFNKLDFLFFAMPLSFCFFILNHKSIRDLVFRYSERLLLFFVLLIVCFSAFYSYLLPKYLSLPGLTYIPFSDKFYSFISVLAGTSVYKVLGGVLTPTFYGTSILLLFLVPILFSLFIAVSDLKKSRISLNTLLVFILTVYFLALFFVPIAGGPHHFIPLLPVVILNIVVFFEKASISTKRMSLYFLLFLFYYLILFYQYFTFISLPKTNVFWSKGIDLLANELIENYQDKRILLTDWGLSNQLLILSDGVLKLEEPFRPIRKLSDTNHLNYLQNYSKENSVAVRFYSSKVLEPAVSNFDYAYYKHHKTISYEGKPLYVLYYNEN